MSQSKVFVNMSHVATLQTSSFSFCLALLDHKMKTHTQELRATLRWTDFPVFMKMILWQKCPDQPELNSTRTAQLPSKEKGKYSHR